MSFHVFVGYVHMFFGKMSVYILTYYYFEPIIIWVIYFFWYWAAWAVCVFRRLIPYQLLCCKYFLPFFCCYCSLSRILLFVTPWTTAHQASQFFTISRACSNLCPSTWWCHPTISSSVVPFSSCPQSFPASESFLMSWLFASGGQSIGSLALVWFFSHCFHCFPIHLPWIDGTGCHDLLFLNVEI